MSFEKIDNVTWLPATTTTRRRAEADVESAGRFDRSLADRQGAVSARTSVDGTTNSFAEVSERLRPLLNEQSVLTDSSPAIRDQFGQVEQILARSTPPQATAESGGPAVIVEISAGIRFNTQSERLEFNSGSHESLDSPWLTGDQLSRQQVMDKGAALLQTLEDPGRLNVFVAHSFVPDAVLEQRFSLDDPIVVTQNREFQLTRLDEAGQIAEVEIIDADGSIISSSHYDDNRNQLYREYFDDGSVGLEISYDSNQQVREVSYFDADQKPITREHYDSNGVLTHSDQLTADGEIAHTDYF